MEQELYTKAYAMLGELAEAIDREMLRRCELRIPHLDFCLLISCLCHVERINSLDEAPRLHA